MKDADPHQLLTEFARRLRSLREERGLSQRQLALAVNAADHRDHFNRPVIIHWAYISRIESADRWPSLAVIDALAEQLNITPEYLLNLAPRSR